MKFKLAILVIIAFSIFTFSEITILEEKKVGKTNTVKVLCIDGHKFISQGNGAGTPVNLVQVYRQRGSLVVPVECECDKTSSKEKEK